MQVSIEGLGDRTDEVVAAVQAGEPVTLTSGGEPIGDIVPRRRRERWLSGAWLREQLIERSADPGLRRELFRLAGERVDEV